MNDPNPLVSICIPVFNGELLMHLALESCLHQTYRNIEIIVVDNVSTDRTPEIVSRYCATDSRVKSFRNEKRVVPEENALQSFQLASGKYVQLLHHDDWLSQNYIEEGIRNFNAYPDTAAVSTNLFSLAHLGETFSFLDEVVLPAGNYPTDYIFRIMYKYPEWGTICIFALMRKTDVLNALGLNVFRDPVYEKLYPEGHWIDALTFLKVLLGYDYVTHTNRSAYLKLDHASNLSKESPLFYLKNPQRLLEHFQNGRQAFECLYDKELKKYRFDLRVAMGSTLIGTLLLHHAKELFRTRNYPAFAKNLSAFFSDYSFGEKLAVGARLPLSIMIRALNFIVKRIHTKKEFSYDRNYFLNSNRQFILEGFSPARIE